MKIQQSFSVELPRQDVWDMFQDVPAIAECMPGATLTGDKGDGVYTGALSIRLGPFTAAFEGEVRHAPDPQGYRGHVDGKAVDKRGGSRSRVAMEYALTEDAQARTTVTVDADVTLSGPIAQFGRMGVIEETAALLIEQFVANIETRLAASRQPESAAEPVRGDDAGGSAAPGTQTRPAAAANSISGFAFFGHVVRRLFRRLFGMRG